MVTVTVGSEQIIFAGKLRINESVIHLQQINTSQTRSASQNPGYFPH